METLLFALIFTLGFGASLGYFTFLLHHTDLVKEYACALRLGKVFNIEEYLKWNENQDGPYKYYPSYISDVCTGFWGHLFGCPFCFTAFICFWGGLLLSIIFVNPWFALGGSSAAFVAGLTYLVTSVLYKKM